nr:signal peptidase I [uncultured Actinotalea sp.]
MRLIRRTAAALATSLAVFALLAVGLLFFLVRGEGWLLQTVATGSMEPTIPTGSIILSRPVDPTAVRIDDVVVFVAPTGGTVSTGDGTAFEATEPMLVTHRVLAVETGADAPAFRTKGDANADEDPWLVEADAVRAGYVGHVPELGTVLATPELRRYLFLTIAGLGMVVVVAECVSIARQLRRADPGPDSAGRHLRDQVPPATDPASPAPAEPRHPEPRHTEPRHAAPPRARSTAA